MATLVNASCLHKGNNKFVVTYETDDWDLKSNNVIVQQDERGVIRMDARAGPNVYYHESSTPVPVTVNVGPISMDSGHVKVTITLSPLDLCDYI